MFDASVPPAKSGPSKCTPMETWSTVTSPSVLYGPDVMLYWPMRSSASSISAPAGMLERSKRSRPRRCVLLLTSPRRMGNPLSVV